MHIQKRPWLCFFAFALLGLAMVEWLIFCGWGCNVICFYAAGVLLWQGLSTQTPKDWLWLCLGSCYALSFALLDQPLLSPFLALGLPLCLGLWAMGGLSAGPWAAARGFFPLKELPPLCRSLWQGLSQSKRLGRIALGAALALPLLLAAGALLASAEEAFRRLIAQLFNGLGEGFGETALKLTLALALSLYLCCLMRGCAGPAKPAPSARPQGDPLVISVMLGLLCGLYALFLGISCQALPHLFAPGGEAVLYSRYARQGFFQLCAAAALNLGVFLAVRRFPRAGRGIARGLQVLLAVLTLALIALAMIKMALYIRLYGLTLLRLYTSCFMGLMALFFLVLIASLFRPLPAGRAGAVMAAAALAALSLTDAGGLLAQANVSRYLAGDLTSLDLTQYADFPAAAAPALARAYREVRDPALLAELEGFFAVYEGRPLPSPWAGSLQARGGHALIQSLSALPPGVD